jgi:hypothetical protein
VVVPGIARRPARSIGPLHFDQLFVNHRGKLHVTFARLEVMCGTLPSCVIPKVVVNIQDGPVARRFFSTSVEVGP